MREELYIPYGHPLACARDGHGAWRRALNDPDLLAVAVFAAVGTLASIYCALYFALPNEMCALAGMS